MVIYRYDDAKASGGHGDSIRAYRATERGALDYPFDSAWGYLPGPGQLEPHAHPTEEIFFILGGRGTMTVGGESAAVVPGDIVEIPPDSLHTLANEQAEPLLWAALWWPHKQP